LFRTLSGWAGALVGIAIVTQVVEWYAGRCVTYSPRRKALGALVILLVVFWSNWIDVSRPSVDTIVRLNQLREKRERDGQVARDRDRRESLFTHTMQPMLDRLHTELSADGRK
jgi:hypothetical protein